jgi:hypothetical protein
MITRLCSHIRSNAVAYLALFIALGGTGYAATNLPALSVGTRQLRNGAVTTAKLAKSSVAWANLDPKTIGGAVLHWAQVSADGQIESSSGQAKDDGIARDGNYVISWSGTFPTRCIAVATTRATGGVLSPASGFANTSVAGGKPTAVVVNTYDAQGQPSPAGFSLAVIC